MHIWTYCPYTYHIFFIYIYIFLHIYIYIPPWLRWLICCPFCRHITTRPKKLAPGTEHTAWDWPSWQRWTHRGRPDSIEQRMQHMYSHFLNSFLQPLCLGHNRSQQVTTCYNMSQPDIEIMMSYIVYIYNMIYIYVYVYVYNLYICHNSYICIYVCV